MSMTSAAKEKMKNQKKRRRRVKERDRDKEKKELVRAKLDHAKSVLCSLPGGFPHLKIIISVSGWSLCHSSPSALLLLAFFYSFCFFPISICRFLSSLLLHVLAEFLLLFLLLCLIFWNRKLVVNFLLHVVFV